MLWAFGRLVVQYERLSTQHEMLKQKKVVPTERCHRL